MKLTDLYPSTLDDKRKGMTCSKIKVLQKRHGLHVMQGYINTGQAWTLEGSVGRYAADLLNSGACILPKVERNGYFGARIKSRYTVKKGDSGSFRKCQDFWIGVEMGINPVDTHI